MARIGELKQKEIINIRDGGRLGFACDAEFDIEKGIMTAIIAPGPGKMLGVFGRGQDYRIPWCDLRQIGDDTIIIDCEPSKLLTDD